MFGLSETVSSLVLTERLRGVVGLTLCSCNLFGRYLLCSKELLVLGLSETVNSLVLTERLRNIIVLISVRVTCLGS